MYYSDTFKKILNITLLLLALLVVQNYVCQTLVRKLFKQRPKRVENMFQEENANAEKFVAALRLVESSVYNLNFTSGVINATDRNYVIPNIVHYVRYKSKRLSFVEYICLRSAYVKQKPDFIFVHTDSPHGLKGKYWRWIKREQDLYNRVVILPSEMPTEVFGHKLNHLYRFYHASDVVRLQVLKRYGGIYLDNDMFVINNLDKYRKHEMTVSWPDGENRTIGNMIVIANRNARFLARWLDNYRDYRSDSWY